MSDVTQYITLDASTASPDRVTLTQIDGTTNEHGKLKVEGFPTILFFPAGKDQTPIPYDGGRNLKVP